MKINFEKIIGLIVGTEPRGEDLSGLHDETWFKETITRNASDAVDHLMGHFETLKMSYDISKHSHHRDACHNIVCELSKYFNIEAKWPPAE